MAHCCMQQAVTVPLQRAAAAQPLAWERMQPAHVHRSMRSTACPCEHSTAQQSLFSAAAQHPLTRRALVTPPTPRR